MKSASLAFLLPTVLGVAACGEPKVATTGPAVIDTPVSDGLPRKKATAEHVRQSPPPPGATKESPFPNVARSKLQNGLQIDVVTARALPVVHARVVVKAGSGYGGVAGLGDLAAEMLKDGGTGSMTSAELLRRIETLGADLSISVRADSTTIGLALTKDKLAEGLQLLSQVVREPRYDDGELKKYKSRTIDQTDDALRSDGRFTANYVVKHEVYPANHPYANGDGLPSQIAKIDRAQVDAFHRKFYVPSNAVLVLAGDIDEAQAKDLAQKNFGGWTGPAAPKVEIAEPKAIEKSKVVIAHRPKSAQSDVFVAMIGPERHDKEWAKYRVANMILGGGVASRLFADVREQRSLAYNVSASFSEVAHGKQAIVLYAGTQTAKTGEAVTGLLENVERMQSNPPAQNEVETARRYLSDSFAITMETVGAISSLVGTQEGLGLSDNYWEEYRKQLRATQTSDADEAAAKLFGTARAHSIVVVSGDADAIGNDLARFGEVTVVDPEHEFKTLKTIPAAK